MYTHTHRGVPCSTFFCALPTDVAGQPGTLEAQDTTGREQIGGDPVLEAMSENTQRANLRMEYAAFGASFLPKTVSDAMAETLVDMYYELKRKGY